MAEPPTPDRSPLERLRAVILGSPKLQAQLGAIEDGRLFAAAAEEAAAAAGIAVDPGAIEVVLRVDPAYVSRFDGGPPTLKGWSPPGWLPDSIVAAGPELAVDWTWVGDAPLTQPFFTDSLQRARRRPLNSFVRARSALRDFAESVEPELAEPAGLIFHWSRCGSTLVAQMAAALPDTVVVSEAPALDQVVQLARSQPDVPEQEIVALIRAMVAALGRGADGMRRRLIVKLDSWHTLALPLFRRAFPQTPWLFLFRDPIDVLVSQRRIPGLQTVPGIMGDLFGIGLAEGVQLDVYRATVLERIASALLEHWPLGGGLALDYTALPEAVTARIFPHFGIEPTTADRAIVAEVSRRHAKDPRRQFTPDSEVKRQEADDALRQSAARLDPVYRRLRALAAG